MPLVHSPCSDRAHPRMTMPFASQSDSPCSVPIAVVASALSRTAVASRQYCRSIPAKYNARAWVVGWRNSSLKASDSRLRSIAWSGCPRSQRATDPNAKHTTLGSCP